MMLPRVIEHVDAPPIKIQGIKSDLVPLIARSIRWDGSGRWIEPFAGSCVVALNVRPSRALIADTNPHLIRLMKAIASGELTPQTVRAFLVENGRLLLERGEQHYYDIRARFNAHGEPLDFLFVNRSCFNGVMRFNKKGGFNVPFCRKPERFRQAYVTKIVNQVAWVRAALEGADWEFVCQDWRATLAQSRAGDFVYLDPPYVGRHTDYYNQWSDEQAEQLADVAGRLSCGVAASMWLENEFRKNDHVGRSWGQMARVTTSHFYHVGSSEEYRHPMIEVLLVPPSHLAVASEGDGGSAAPMDNTERLASGTAATKRAAKKVKDTSVVASPVAPVVKRRPGRPRKSSELDAAPQEPLPFGAA